MFFFLHGVFLTFSERLKGSFSDFSVNKKKKQEQSIHSKRVASERAAKDHFILAK